MKTNKISAKEFEKKFDAGDDLTPYLDYSKIRRPNEEQKRVNVDFPVWMIHLLDREAKHLGVARQSVIKMWISKHLVA